MYVHRFKGRQTAAVRRREALESILQLVAVALLAVGDGEHSHGGVVVVPFIEELLFQVASIDNVRPGLANGIFQGAGDCEGGAHAEHEAQEAAIQFPKAILQPVAAGESLQAASSGCGHGRLVREDAVYDHGVEGDDDDGAADGQDGGHGDGDALMLGVGVAETPVLEGKGLVVGLDLVDDHENGEEDAAMIRKEVARHGRGAGSSQDDNIVEDVAAAGTVSSGAGEGLWALGSGSQGGPHLKITRLGRRFLEKGNRSGSLFVLHSSMVPQCRIQPCSKKSPKLPRARTSYAAPGKRRPVGRRGAAAEVEGGMGLGQRRWVGQETLAARCGSAKRNKKSGRWEGVK